MLIVVFLTLAALSGMALGARLGYRAGVRRGLDLAGDMLRREWHKRHPDGVQ